MPTALAALIAASMTSVPPEATVRDATAGKPHEIQFATKPALATEMIACCPGRGTGAVGER